MNNVNGNGIEIEYIESDISKNILDKIELQWMEQQETNPNINEKGQILSDFKIVNKNQFI